MERKYLIEAVENETKNQVKGITWIYGIGEYIGDGEGDLYHYDVTLQIEFISGEFISLTADNYCEDRSRVIATTIGSYEPYTDYNDFGDTSEELESMLFDYLETYGDEAERPARDLIYFESM